MNNEEEEEEEEAEEEEPDVIEEFLSDDHCRTRLHSVPSVLGPLLHFDF